MKRKEEGIGEDLRKELQERRKKKEEVVGRIKEHVGYMWNYGG